MRRKSREKENLQNQWTEKKDWQVVQNSTQRAGGWGSLILVVCTSKREYVYKYVHASSRQELKSDQPLYSVSYVSVRSTGNNLR